MRLTHAEFDALQTLPLNVLRDVTARQVMPLDKTKGGVRPAVQSQSLPEHACKENDHV